VPTIADTTLEAAAGRLAALLAGRVTTLSDPVGGDLEFEAAAVPRPLDRQSAPADTWAVDGGQALVADARCLALVVTRTARVRYRGGSGVEEDQGPLRACLLGGADDRVAALAGLQLPGLRPDTPVDVNLLRDRWEWDAVRRSVADADHGAMVLVDGDLQPDWRIPSGFLTEVLSAAAERGVTLVGVTKHSSLARGGAPLLGALEREAESGLGPRAQWWAPVARVRGDVAGGGIQVVAARLDPDARFAFRVDLPAAAEPEEALGRLSALCDDAAFAGYPYPLSVADRLAACPAWLRADLRLQLDDHLERAGLHPEVRERAFADRHHLMERS
jgi:hypothetical protein